MWKVGKRAKNRSHLPLPHMHALNGTRLAATAKTKRLVNIQSFTSSFSFIIAIFRAPTTWNPGKPGLIIKYIATLLVV